MALNFEVEIYDKEGNALDERLFGTMMSAKKWANDQDAALIKVYNAEEDEEHFYIRGGAQNRWQESNENLFNRRLKRMKEKAEA